MKVTTLIVELGLLPEAVRLTVYGAVPVVDPPSTRLEQTGSCAVVAMGVGVGVVDEVPTEIPTLGWLQFPAWSQTLTETVQDPVVEGAVQVFVDVFAEGTVPQVADHV